MFAKQQKFGKCMYVVYQDYWTPEQVIDPAVQAAIETIQTKEGLKEQTIKYLRDYQYGETLVITLARVIK